MRLYRHFLRSFFQSDLVGQGGDPRSLAVGMAAAFSAPGVILCLYLVLVAGYFDPTPELAFFIALSLALAGLLAVVEWDELFPSRTDVLVLRSLPLAPAAIVGAKLAALATLMAGFALIVNFNSNLLLPVMSAPVAANGLWVLRHMGAQLVATLAASVWAFLVVVAVKGAVLAVDGGGRQVGAWARFGLLTGLLAALLLTPNLLSPRNLAAVVARGGRGDPLLWFIGLDKLLAGGATPAWRAWGQMAAPALLGTAAAALGLYALGCWVQFRAALANAGTGRAGMRLATAALAGCCRPVRQRAVARFAAATLARSRRHRLYLSAWLGLGVAFALLGALGTDTVGRLAAPLVIGFFLLLGLRHVFSIPTELRSNWIFRMSETAPQCERLGAAPKLMVACAVVPLLLATAPYAVYFWGWRHGLAHLAVVALLALGLAALLVAGFRKLPFTCSYLPGKSNAKVMWVAGWIALSLYAHASAAWELGLWRQPARLALDLALGAALLAVLAWALVRWGRGLQGCQFDDDAEVLIQSLFTRD